MLKKLKIQQLSKTSFDQKNNKYHLAKNVNIHTSDKTIIAHQQGGKFLNDQAML